MQNGLEKPVPLKIKAYAVSGWRLAFGVLLSAVSQ